MRLVGGRGGEARIREPPGDRREGHCGLHACQRGPKFDALASSQDVALVGLVTDDPLHSEAKISMQRRFWRYYSEHERERCVWGLIHRALERGLPVHTRNVRCDAFRRLLSQWAPKAIVLAGFGQIIDGPVIEFPRYGIHNVHPSDLLGGHGAGPQPGEDVVARKAAVTRVSIIWVTPEVGGGTVVALDEDEGELTV